MPATPPLPQRTPKQYVGKLLDHPNFEQRRNSHIYLFNLAQWSLRFHYLTIPFAVEPSDPEKAAQYDKLSQDLYDFYSVWYEDDFGLISPDELETVTYAVVGYSLNGNHSPISQDSEVRFVRVKLAYKLYSNKKNHLFRDAWNYPFITFTCLDFEAGVRVFIPSQMKLFHLEPRFTEIERRINLLYMKNTQPIGSLLEFRAAFSNLFKEYRDQSYEGEFKLNDSKDLTVVEMLDGKYCEDVYRETIKLLEPIKEPAVGEKYNQCKFSHIDADGTVYIQYPSTYQYKLYLALSQVMSCTLIEHVAANGPYELEPNQIYLTKYEGWYYRCTLDTEGSAEAYGYSMNGPEEILVYFVDFGNRIVCKTEELVPCRFVSLCFSLYPPQALKAKINVKNVAYWDVLVSYPEFVNIRTLVAATESSLPLIEVLKHCDEKPNDIAYYLATEPGEDRDPDSRPDQNIVDLLVNGGLATKADENIHNTVETVKAVGRIPSIDRLMAKYQKKIQDKGLRWPQFSD